MLVFFKNALSAPQFMFQGFVLWLVPAVILSPRSSVATGTCGGNFVSDVGTISSPNFPENYGSFERCLYTVTVPGNNRIMLSFETFELEGYPPCNQDYVKIRDGHELSSPVVGPFCGWRSPGRLLSSGNKVSIEFRTDGSNEYKGFSLKFEKVALTSKTCPVESTEWMDLGGNYCYIVEKIALLDWNDALYECNKAGGSLASFHSKTELDRVHNHISKIGYGTYTIGLKKNGDGTFEWTDKSPLDYENWISGEPNDKREMCTVMYPSSGKWGDIFCHVINTHICSSQKAVRPSFSSGLPKICPSRDWRNFGGDFCYKVEKSDNYTWNQALDICVEKGGSLASFHSAEELSLVLRKIEESQEFLHIGFQQTDDGDFNWVDKTIVDFVNWDYDEPNFANDTCSAMYSNSGKWHDISCSKQLGYICSTPKVNPSTTTGGLNMACIGTSDGWTDFGGDFCYVIEQSEATWAIADSRCKTIGGNLASFHSLTEVNRVQGHLVSSGPPVFIGLQESSEEMNNFFWTDGTAPDFFNWDKGEPNTKSEKCVEMYQDSGKWNDIYCTVSRGYICSRPKVPSCSGRVCKNGGVCIEGYDTPPRCDCARGYKGLQCEQKVTCADNPCKNGASCNEKKSAYVCSCKHGYAGYDCQEILCSANPCENSGTCEQDGTNGISRCICKHGYQGLTCAEKILCENDTCENGGLCTQDGINGVFRCTCQHGYQGLLCEEKILCENRTCENEGLCTQDGTNGVFRCTCQHGYQGPICEEKILCENGTCENGGLCTQDGINGVFRCTCDHGFEGLLCEEKILCENDTCENGGLCTQDGLNGIFRCTCDHGFEGLLCEEKILCERSTCENGGVCTQDGINGVFRCTCQHGFQGPMCEEKIFCATDTCKNGGTCTQDKNDGIFRCICREDYSGLTCEESIPPYAIRRVGDKENIIRGNIVFDIHANIVFD